MKQANRKEQQNDSNQPKCIKILSTMEKKFESMDTKGNSNINRNKGREKQTDKKRCVISMNSSSTDNHGASDRKEKDIRTRIKKISENNFSK